MTRRDQDLKTRLIATFREESEELLRVLTEGFLVLEQGRKEGSEPVADQEILERCFRAAHTLKGAARSIGVTSVEDVCQALESVLRRMAGEGGSPSSAVLDLLHECVQGLERLTRGDEDATLVRDLAARLEATSDGSGESDDRPASGGAQPSHALDVPRTSTTADSIRIPAAKLHTLSLYCEELLAAKLRAAEHAREAYRLLEMRTDSTRDTTESLRGHSHPVPSNAADLVAALRREERLLSDTVDRLHDAVRDLRMSPATLVLDLFPRMVRDISREQGKEVNLTISGAELELDRKVLETIKDPLIHLVRNAIDHGIEPPDARAAIGKPPQGALTLSLHSLEEKRILIEVRDDGAGIDPVNLRQAGLRAGFLGKDEAAPSSDEEVMNLIYRSGFSTSPVVTRISGRGLGLSIVTEGLEQLGGRLELHSEVGVGTTVRMIVPATVVTFRGLLVRAGNQPFLLPLETVGRVVRMRPEEIRVVEGRRAVHLDDGVIPAAGLNELLGRELQAGEEGHKDKVTCVIVEVVDQQLALLVQDVIGDREVLVKELEAPLKRVRHIAGAGVLGSGQIVLILRPGDLLRAARSRHRPRREPVAKTESRKSRPVILVVDDSITTRSMEKNLLETAGYNVKVAVDGVDALTILKSETCDLVVSDVDMPRMDGFELTQQIRADEKLSDLPVVLVTALESRDDKEKGIAVGANAYVMKSRFDESNLLEIIERLL